MSMHLYIYLIVNEKKNKKKIKSFVTLVMQDPRKYVNL